jgi:nucleoside-diphosphate-sugar epimerase
MEGKVKLLIIGGAGYLGTELCKRALIDERDVTVIDNFTYNQTKLKNVKYINDDVKNIWKYKKIVEQFDKIYYLASPRLNELNDRKLIDEHLLYLENTIKMVPENCDFYFISSCSVYGKSKEIVNENSPVQITSLYSELKIRSEELIKNLPNNFKIFRLATLYGVGQNQRNDILINELVTDVINNKTLQIYDPDSNRPHLNVRDCALILNNLMFSGFEDKILNIGFDFQNISKRQIVNLIEDILERNLYVTFNETNDSRDYKVDFSLLKKIIDIKDEDILSFRDGIYELYVGKINFAVEDWDSIIDYYRPNGSSKTWYMEEEGKLDYPKMWGFWNIFDTHDSQHKMFSIENFNSLSIPSFRDEHHNLLKVNEDSNENYVYFINIFDPSYFKRNEKIGFSTIHKKYLDDCRRGKCKIILGLTLEGYSGIESNRDLEILKKWVIWQKLPKSGVLYISGNINIDKLQEIRNLNFEVVGLSHFEIWLNFKTISDNPIKFKKDTTSKLFLMHARNTRDHRVKFVCDLIEKNLFERGMISMEAFTADDVFVEHKSLNSLIEKLPLVINDNLNQNLCNDVNFNDYEKTFVSVISETLIEKETLFITEKTWKALFVGHPFIMFGNPFTLKKLKEWGFKTFENWWDESYDEEIDLDLRIEKIQKILLDLSKKTDEELIKIREEMIPVLKHNMNHYYLFCEKKYCLDHNSIYPNKPLLKIIKDFLIKK